MKGHQHLIEAMGLLAARHPRLHLAICGRGDLDGALVRYRIAGEAAAPGSVLRLHAALRLGLVYGERGDYEKELVIYRSLAGR